MTSKEPQKAVDWVERAKAFYAATGKEIALAEFTNPRGQFVQDAALYFRFGPERTDVGAWHTNQLFVGKNFIGVKDTAGKMFIREIVDIAREKGAGWTTITGPIRLSESLCPRPSISKKSTT